MLNINIIVANVVVAAATVIAFVRMISAARVTTKRKNIRIRLNDLINLIIFKLMKIQVLGSGCPTCKKLYEITKKAVAEAGIKAEVEYSTDIQKLVEMNVMQSPVLAIDGKPVFTGYVPDMEKIKEAIKQHL